MHWAHANRPSRRSCRKQLEFGRENVDRFVVRALTSSASGAILRGSLVRPSGVDVGEDEAAPTSSGQALGRGRDKILRKV